MADDHKRKLAELARGISALDRALQKKDTNDLKQLLKIIRKPGFTTPAELQLLIGIVESLTAQTQAITRLRGVLLRGSRLV